MDLLNIGLIVKFDACEIGCRGLIAMDNSNRLYTFCHAIPGFKFKQVVLDILKILLVKLQSQSIIPRIQM